METRVITITVTLTWDGDDAAELAHARTGGELQDALAEVMSDDVAESLLEGFAAGLQADSVSILIDTPDAEEAR